jgi:hypothetical protein
LASILHFNLVENKKKGGRKIENVDKLNCAVTLLVLASIAMLVILAFING